jgi:pimeloyl-ACP methyl ester carboxylesterase
VHGFKGFKDWGTHHLVASHFAQNGFDFLKFNFSHNGISVGSNDEFDDLEGFAQNTFSKELEDLNAVITFALSGKKFKRPTHLYLIGHSLGGGISIIKASEHQEIAKLATWASISSFRNLWSPQQEVSWLKDGVLHFQNSRTNQQMPIYSSLLDDLNQNSERLDILGSASKVSIPWLIVHGDNDTSVSSENALGLHKQSPGSELSIIPTADHVFGASHLWPGNYLPEALNKACTATIAFFNQTLD